MTTIISDAAPAARPMPPDWLLCTAIGRRAYIAFETLTRLVRGDFSTRRRLTRRDRHPAPVRCRSRELPPDRAS